jgi:hypothetical protein
MLEFKKGDNNLVAYVFRIDGLISPTMRYFEPRWVAFNSPGVMPMVIRNDIEAIHSPLIDPSYGNLSIILAPGHHVVEYTTDYMPLAYRCMGYLVRIAEFDAVAGMTYQIVVDKAEGNSLSNDGRTIHIESK